MDTLAKFLKVLVAAIALAVIGIVLWTAFHPKPIESQTVSQTYSFTWPGDDGMVGTCSSIELRWSRNAIVGTDTTSWWNAATRYSGPYPVPKVAGTPDSMQVLGLPNDTFIYAVAKACDEVPNCSGFSNVASVKTKDFVPPAPPQGTRWSSLLRRIIGPRQAIAGGLVPTVVDSAIRDRRDEAVTGSPPDVTAPAPPRFTRLTPTPVAV